MAFFKNGLHTDSLSSRVIAFLGARGGVGTTTFAVHTATELAKAGKHVLYIDFNFDNPAAFRYLNVRNENLKTTVLSDLRKMDVALEDLIVETGVKRVRLLSASDVHSIGESLGIKLDLCKKVIELASSRFDVVVIDCDSNIYSEATIAAISVANNLFVVTEPDPSLLVAIAKLKPFVLAVSKKDKVQVILQNKAIGKVFTSKDWESLGVKVLGTQYYSVGIAKSGSTQDLTDYTYDEETREFSALISDIIDYVCSALTA